MANTVKWQHHEGGGIHEEPFNGDPYKDAFTPYVWKVNSKEGGYVEVRNEKGEILRRHPRLKTTLL